jgi:protein-tyrosine phosphatase
VERRIEVEGCHNFRDLGGYPAADGRVLRWRTLFRSDGLHELTDAGVSTVRDELRIGDIIDLRSSAELALDGRGPLADEPMRFHHLPLFDGDATEQRDDVARPETLGQLYVGMIEFAAAPITAVIETLATGDAPAVFHCAAGKDRTGVISALILGSLGVPDEVIVADYAATREGLEEIVARLNRSEGYADIWKELPPDTLHASPETMIDLLGTLQARHGSVRDCARAIGVSESVLEALEERMLS